MSIQEQQKMKQEYYKEAIRYMDNAKGYLKSAKKRDNFYNDKKYVKTACGAAYNGVLIALDCFFMLKGVPEPKNDRRSILYYRDNIARLDKKLLNTLNSAYEILHLFGYYDGITSASVVKEGFDYAYVIIERIKP